MHTPFDQILYDAVDDGTIPAEHFDAVWSFAIYTTNMVPGQRPSDSARMAVRQYRESGLAGVNRRHNQ